MSNAGLPEGLTPRRHGATRLVLGAAAAAVLVFVVVAIAAVVLNGRAGGGPAAARDQATNNTRTSAPGTSGTGPDAGSNSWDLASENAIASKSMMQFGVEAAEPHTLSTRTAGPALTLPAATARTGIVAQGFPRTPEGAVAQLKALDEAGMVGLDPDAYDLAYREVALPGAPPSANTGLAQVATRARSTAGLAPTSAVTGLTSTYQVSAGLIKGASDDGAFVVACVVGELSATTPSAEVQAGVGDCQAMRWVDGRWWISPTDLPSAAPCAWPGTEEAVIAGYRAVTFSA